MEFRSDLGAPADEVWAAATHFAGINDELRPLMRMTSPRGWGKLSPERIEPGQRLFRSWLLLLGVVPVDYDDLTIAELGPGRRFRERSAMMSASVWEHERLVEPTGPGTCRITDRVAFKARTALHAAVLRRIVPQLFAHRHRRLRRRFGAAGGSRTPSDRSIPVPRRRPTARPARGAPGPQRWSSWRRSPP